MQSLGAKSSSQIIYGLMVHAPISYILRSDQSHGTYTQTHKTKYTHTPTHANTNTGKSIKKFKCQRSIPFPFLQFDVHKARDRCFAMMLESGF